MISPYLWWPLELVLFTNKIDRFNRLVDKDTGSYLVYLDLLKASEKTLLNICYLSDRMEVCVVGD